MTCKTYCRDNISRKLFYLTIVTDRKMNRIYEHDRIYFSGYLIAFRIDDRQDNAFNTATIKAFSSVPDKLKKSFTVDNGKEFAAHKELSDATGMKVYFCDPYSPWQRGTNENTNGLLRQFFSKGTSFANISYDDLQHIVDLINNRPRKRLGFRTPLEVLYKFFR